MMNRNSRMLKAKKYPQNDKQFRPCEIIKEKEKKKNIVIVIEYAVIKEKKGLDTELFFLQYTSCSVRQLRKKTIWFYKE